MDILEIIGNMTATEIVIRLIGLGLIAGSLFAVLATRRRSRIVSGFVEAKAFTRDESKTLPEAGLRDSFSNRFALREGTVLSRYVVRTDAGGAGAAEEGEADEADEETPKKAKKAKKAEKAGQSGRYYVPEDKKDEAELRLIKKAPMLGWVAGAVILAAATELAVRIVPALTERFF